MANSVTFKLPKAPADPPLLRIEPFKGINLSVTPTQIDQHQASDMLNLNIDERGALNKRTGYEKTYDLGTGNINGMYNFRKSDGTAVFLIAKGTQLYNETTSIYSGLADNDVHFFTMNDKCYIMDGTNYLVYDGTTASEVEPYIPTLTIARLPSGGGSPNDDFNLLGSGFKDSFSADGTSTVYQLSLTGLDATAVTAEVDGVAKAETTDFTVDRTNGKVTFTTAPAEGTDNVIITAYKTFADKPNQIKKCTFSILYGGANDTRVFVSGNKDFPNWMWRLGLEDPTYAPENGFYKVGSDAEKIQGFARQYDYLVIEKENSKWNMTYELNGGDATFPIKPINDQIGTKAPKSLQIIENNPVSLDRTGVYMLVSSNVRNENNVVHLSANIDPRLLAESNLENAVSIDFDRKYWLCVNGNVYLFDYTLKEWYIYDNIHATCFLEKDSQLYFGTSNGIVYRFMKDTEPKPYNDDGAPINTFWKSKHFVFGADELRKLVDRVYIGIKPNTRTSATLSYVTNKKGRDDFKTVRMDLMDFNNIDFNHWSFLTSSFPQESMAKVKAKKITHFQLIIENNEVDESLGLLSTGIKYRYQSSVK